MAISTKTGLLSLIDFIGTLFTSFFKSVLVPLLVMLTKRAGKTLKMIIGAIKYPPKLMYRLYFGMLGTVYKASRRLGMAGELILLIFGVVWMFWPMCLPFIFKNTKNRLGFWITSIMETGFHWWWKRAGSKLTITH